MAKDESTGDLGIAVASKYLAVGSIVPYGRADAGVVATQFFAHPGLAELALDLLAEGSDPAHVLDTILASDPHEVRRQFVAMRIDGKAASVTGEACLHFAGSVEAQGVVCSGNTLASSSVLDEMLSGYLIEPGEPFWSRLVRALECGQAAGGDRHGQQSASLLVIRADAGYGGYTDRLIDLRVDDHEYPLSELARLVDVWKMSVVE